MKNQTNVDPYVKWDNVLIKFGDNESIPMVKFFWDTIGLETSFALLGGYYYMGVVIPINNTINVMDFTILSFQEAVEIYNKQYKKFPRDMYVWNNDGSDLIKRNVVFIVKDHCIKYNVMTYHNGVWVSYKHAMEVEEYEAMNKNKEILDEISNTKKQMNELNDKLSQLQDKLKY